MPPLKNGRLEQKITKDTKTDFLVYPAVTVKAYIFRAQFGKRHRNPLHSESVFVILVAFCFNACGFLGGCAI
jgi:hypothetical protein